MRNEFDDIHYLNSAKEPDKHRLGKRKSKRQLSFNESTHIILRLKENLPPLFDPHDKNLRQHVYRISKKYNIRMYHLIFNHSHLHGVLLLPNRKSYVSFIRELTGFLTKYFTDQLKIPGLIFKNIFSNRPFTRSVPWGRAYQILINYMRKNEQESQALQMNLKPTRIWRQGTMLRQQSSQNLPQKRV